MEMIDYLNLDAQGLAECIKTRSCSAERALELALARSEAVNSDINAITHYFPDWGRAQLAKMRGDEPFYGVPLLVKDLGFTIQHQPNRAGSVFLKDQFATKNHTMIDALLDLGFVPFGLTNTPEFGLSYVTEPVLFGPCRNPYDLERTSGGSSGGSAAAVAAGIVPVATASDGGGSIRVPAACCGLVGFKPGSGLMPGSPCSAEPWSGMAVSFMLGRSLRDMQALFKAFLNTTLPFKPVFPPCAPPRFIRAPGLFQAIDVQARWQQAVDDFAARLAQANYTVIEKKTTLDTDTIGNATLTLIKANLAADFQSIYEETGRHAGAQQLEPISWQFLEQGKALSASDVLIAKDTLYQALAPLRALLAEGDVILSPALATDPLPHGALSMSDDYDNYLLKSQAFSPFTALANQAGIPAIALPVPHQDSLPLAVQLIMGKWRDSQLLELSETLLEKDIWQPYPVKATLGRGQ